MWELMNQVERDCEKAACACDGIVDGLDALDDFSIAAEDDRSESEGGIPEDIDVSPSSDDRAPHDYADPDFDELADFEEMF